MGWQPGELALGVAQVAESEIAAARAALLDGIPCKETVTVPEAARIMGASVRTVNYWIADGTLLVTYPTREDVSRRRNARVIVRADRPDDPNRNHFLTLEELRLRRSNVNQ